MSFPYCASSFELTIEANGDQAEEEEAVEDENKEEEEDPSLGLLRVLGEYMGWRGKIKWNGSLGPNMLRG